MPISVCLAGATGWVGSAIARTVAERDDFVVVTGVSRTHAGENLGDALGIEAVDAPLFDTVDAALDHRSVDVVIDYTSHLAAKTNTLTALEHRAAVVIGSSGLSAAARHLPTWEIVEYADSSKPDAPSGTSRELAERRAEVHQPQLDVSIEDTAGLTAARGASVADTQVHSVRLPATGMTGGLIALTAYGLVLFAQRSGATAAIAALRETSIVFGAVIGTLALQERMGRRRITAAAVVTVGIAITAVH